MPLLVTRKRLGLTQVRVAELLGTSQANVSAYESGRLTPGSTVAARIAAFTALPEDSIYRNLWPPTLASTAMQLRKDLHAGVSEADMLRVIIQASDDFPKLTSPAERAFFLAEPGPTGDARFDALLAGLAVHLCRESGLESTPAWTRAPGRVLDEIWWFDSPAPSLRALGLRDAVPAMRARGVMFSRRNLESI
ncbi:MAG: helix-turn-helix transcriptional regulator [Actinomycetales bacterium]